MQIFKNKQDRLAFRRKLEQAEKLQKENLRQLIVGVNIGALNKYKARNNRKLSRIAART